MTLQIGRKKNNVRVIMRPKIVQLVVHPRCVGLRGVDMVVWKQDPIKCTRLHTFYSHARSSATVFYILIYTHTELVPERKRWQLTHRS